MIYFTDEEINSYPFYPLTIFAVNSLDEGLEETLTLHRLGMFEFLGISLKTTNCLESLNCQQVQYTRRVSY